MLAFHTTKRRFRAGSFLKTVPRVEFFLRRWHIVFVWTDENKSENEGFRTNSLVSDHRWCTKKCSLTGYGRLKSRKTKKISLSYIPKDITLQGKIRQTNRQLIMMFHFKKRLELLNLCT